MIINNHQIIYHIFEADRINPDLQFKDRHHA